MNCALKFGLIAMILLYIGWSLILMLFENKELRVKLKAPKHIKAHLDIIKNESQGDGELASPIDDISKLLSNSTTEAIEEENTEGVKMIFTNISTMYMASTVSLTQTTTSVASPSIARTTEETVAESTNTTLKNASNSDSTPTFTSNQTITSTTSTYLTTQPLVLNHGTSIIFSPDNGRLGNQLSSFSDILSLEWQYGVRAYLLDFQYNFISLHFESLELTNAVRILSRDFPDYKYAKWTGSYPTFGLQDKSSWPPEKFGAFYKAGTYINNIYNYHQFLPRLRKVFTFKHFLMNEAVLRLREVRDRFIADTSENTSFTFVSVHARRTDYGSHLKILYNLTYVDTSYFLRAMEYFSGKVKNPIFYVLSDDPEWADLHLTNTSFKVHAMQRRPFSMEGNVTLTTNDHIGIDLALLSLANHSILSYGTFGMWGAFLSGGTTSMMTMPLSHAQNEGTAFQMKRANLTQLVFI